MPNELWSIRLICIFLIIGGIVHIVRGKSKWIINLWKKIAGKEVT
jgi:hypothetical protein